MNIAFCTCVKLGLSCIESVLNAGGNFSLLITLNDEKARNKSGRIYLDETAAKYEIPLLKVPHINNDETIDALKAHEIDWLFIIGWSQIASEKVISTPKSGAIGAHPTLLPIGRGRAAIPWAILKGLDKTGVTFFRMDKGVDTGKIILQEEIAIYPNTNATTLYNKVDAAHVDLILRLWPDLIASRIEFREQDESLATTWPGRTPKDGEINSQMTVATVDRLVRATTRPYPGAFFKENGQKIVIWAGKEVEKVTKELTLILSDGFYEPIDFDIEKVEN